jgi:hypothetical protein
MTIQTLIVHDHNIETAKKLALNLNGELEARKSHFRVHTKSKFEIENLRSIIELISIFLIKALIMTISNSWSVIWTLP